MRKQCLMFMLLLAASTAVTQELYRDEKAGFVPGKVQWNLVIKWHFPGLSSP